MKRPKKLTRAEKVALTKKLINDGYALSRAEAEERLKAMSPEQRNKARQSNVGIDT